MKKARNKGITLIALVITIIVLLILAGVGISTLTGEGGILGKANISKEKTLISSYEEQLKLIWQGVKLENVDQKIEKEELLRKCKNEIEKDLNFEGSELALNTELLVLEVKVKEGYIFRIRENVVEYIRKEGEILKDIEVILTSEIKEKEWILTTTVKQAAGRRLEYILYKNDVEIQRKTTYDTTFIYKEISEFGEATARVEVKYEEEKTGESNEIKIENYTIKAQKDLITFQEEVNRGKDYKGKVVQMIEDVDLSEQESNWIPIGTEGKVFRGTFEGNHKKITGLHINSTKEYQGLFGKIEDGTVRNLEIEGSVITTQNYVGVLAGEITGSGTIENIKIGSEGKEVKGSTYVGGVAGRISGTVTLKNSSNSAKVTGNDYVGGIVGEGNIFITRCDNYGEIQGNGKPIGGISGHTDKNIIECSNQRKNSRKYGVCRRNPRSFRRRDKILF